MLTPRARMNPNYSDSGVLFGAQFYLRAEQLRVLISNFTKPIERIELFVIFFCRIVDEGNLDVALAEFTDHERHAVMYRLGPLHVFNPLRPDGLFQLDLSRFDNRTMATILVKLATHEQGRVLCEQRYNGFEFQLPMSWLTNMPNKGVWEVRYATPDDAANLKARCEVAESFLGWKFRELPTDDGGAYVSLRRLLFLLSRLFCVHVARC